MKNEHETKLGAEIDALLKGLPELRAPRTLLPRVMAALEARAASPWYRQSWQSWPASMRVVCLLVLISAFGGICLAGWKLPQADAYASTARVVGHWLATFGAVWGLFSTLLNTVAVMTRHLPGALLAGCLVSLGLAYGLCVGLGAAWMRLAWSRR